MALDAWGIVAVICAGMAAIIALCCAGIYWITRLLIRDFTSTQDDKKLGGILTALLRDAGGLAAVSQEVPVEDMKNQPEPVNNPYTQGGHSEIRIPDLNNPYSENLESKKDQSQPNITYYTDKTQPDITFYTDQTQPNIIFYVEQKQSNITFYVDKEQPGITFYLDSNQPGIIFYLDPSQKGITFYQYLDQPGKTFYVDEKQPGKAFQIDNQKGGDAANVDPTKLARSIKAIIKGPGIGSSQFMELDANDPLKFGYDSPARQQLMNYLKPYTRKVFAIVGLIVTMIVIGMLATLASVVGYSVLSVKL